MDHQLLVIRHGQTEWSLNGRHTGTTNIPLTPTGEQQARMAGEILRVFLDGSEPTLVLTSPRLRARHTAELAKLRVSESTELLAEWNYGEYEGITTDEIHRTVADWSIWSDGAPGGESVDQVGSRAEKVLARVQDALSDGPVVLIGHGHFSRVLVAHWVGLPTASGLNFKIDPAGITVLGHERGTRQITHLNIPALVVAGK